MVARRFWWSPHEAVASSRKTVLQESLHLMMHWCDDAREDDVCPRFRDLRNSVRVAVPLLEQMFNGPWHEARVRHYCCLRGGGSGRLQAETHRGRKRQTADLL